ncbi:hypothetical protein BCR42DRAFT_452238 [Absidia repens]|uniref:BTB domain-containing protein n=1 Tax=Absidia repens TaxID=90262 RepID=A0A1X2IEN6_9FUNG|nr:hypothetical protein BCR42DRAFT_452238 [Absidia repens]
MHEMYINSPPGTPMSAHSYQGALTPSSTYSGSQVHRTTGESLSCLVGASITTVENRIYVLGGFDRYSDEVFNNLYELKMDERQQQQDHQQEMYCWRRVDDRHTLSAGMEKRNDHTATLWNGDKLVVFGGTGEDDDDGHFIHHVAILDLKRMTWEHPETWGMVPTEGRIKHSATIYQDKLYIAGGLNRNDNVADTVLILNLTTYEWMPPIAFVQRSQHTTFIYNKRLYLFGGYHHDMSRSNVLSFLNLETHTVTQLEIDSPSAPPLSGEQFAQICGDQMVVVVATHPSTGSMEKDTLTGRQHEGGGMAGSGLLDDSRVIGDNEHVGGDGSDGGGGRLDDTTRSSGGIGLWNLDLTSMQWQYHDISPRLDRFHWQHFAMAEHASWFVLFGASEDETDETYAMVLRIQLKEHGIVPVPPSQLGTDLAGLLTAGGQAASSADFVIRSSLQPGDVAVHRLVLLARWPHFSHLMSVGMVESLSNSMTLPEPYDVLQAFVRFLYTDALDDNASPDLVADLMVMANLYLLPRLLALCVRRLHACVSNIDSVCKIYQAAVDAGQESLEQRAIVVILRHFGRVIRTNAFRTLSPSILARLLDQIPFFSSILLVPSTSASSSSSSHPTSSTHADHDPNQPEAPPGRPASPMALEG